MEKYFNILELSYTASTAEIKIAYRDLIKQWHPDKFPNDVEKQNIANEKSKEINNAYYFLIKHYKENKPKTEKDAAEEFIWKKVTSSNLHSVGYNEKDKLLRIIFKNGGKYEYENVPKTVFNQLMTASSKGKFAQKNICYNYRYKGF